MIYLDNAATTYPKPESVRRAMGQALSRFGANPGRGGYPMSMATAEQVFACRGKAARMFHADGEENVIFTYNCTQALNMAIKGIARKGDHLIISDLEHNAVYRPVEKLREQGKITYSLAQVVPGDEAATLRNFSDCITPQTRAIVCTHVSNVFGIILPIEKLGQLAKEHQLIFIVDGAQSAGTLPIDMQKMQIDTLCLPGHKNLYGPMGTGMMITRIGEEMDTILEGGTGSVSAEKRQPSFLPDRFESGTENIPGILGLSAGLDFVENQTLERISRYKLSLVQQLYDGLKREPQVHLYAPRPDNRTVSSVLSFNIAEKNSEEVANLLAKRQFALRAGLHCAPLAHQKMETLQTGTVRVCPSSFNKRTEVEALLRAVHSIF